MFRRSIFCLRNIFLWRCVPSVNRFWATLDRSWTSCWWRRAWRASCTCLSCNGFRCRSEGGDSLRDAEGQPNRRQEPGKKISYIKKNVFKANKIMNSQLRLWGPLSRGGCIWCPTCWGRCCPQVWCKWCCTRPGCRAQPQEAAWHRSGTAAVNQGIYQVRLTLLLY